MATARRGKVGSDEAEPGLELREELRSLSWPLLMPFLYLLTRNPSVLKGRDYGRAKQMFFETYVVDGAVALPSIGYERKGRKAGVSFEISDAGISGDSKTECTLRIEGSRLVLVAREIGDSIMRPALPKMYVYPPEDLANYIFFSLNRNIREIVSEYLAKHEADLPPKLVSRLEAYRMLEESLGNLDAEALQVEPANIVVKFDVMYNAEGRKLKLLYLDYYEFNMEELLSTYDNPAVAYGVSFLEESKYPSYGLRTDVISFPVIIRALGLEGEVKTAVRRLCEAVPHLKRGAILFDAWKRAELV